MAKDLFSNQSNTYARYRPNYPQELFDYLLEWTPGRKAAWDCATGNGQAAQVLADHFEEVQATDISAAQLSNAVQKPNIHYHICPAEQTPFADNSFDLITIATAYHWLDWKMFRQEAKRLGRPGAVIAAWAYNTLIAEDEKVNRIILHFYHDVVKDYWDTERRHVDDSYSSVEFDYEPIPTKNFEIDVRWSRDELVGYLQSWSAVQHYIEKHGAQPTDLIGQELQQAWPDGKVLKNFRFPVFLRIGRIGK